MATPTIRGVASGTGATASTNVNACTMPAAAAVGDYAHYFAVTNTLSTMTAPTAASGTWALVVGGDTVGGNLYLYWWEKILEAGDLSATVQATSSISVTSTAGIVVYADSANSIDQRSTVQLKTTASTTGTIPSVTPNADDCLHMYLIATAYSATTNTAVSTSVPSTGGFTELIDNSTTGLAGQNWRGFAVGTRDLAQQANTAQGTFTVTTGAGTAATRDISYAWTIAVTEVTEAQNTFEGGTDGTTITTANSGGASGDPFDWIAIPAGATVTYSADRPMRGSLCGKITQTTGGTCYLSYASQIGTLVAGSLFGRAYLRVSSLAVGTNGARIAAVSTSSNAFSAEWRLNTSGQIEQRSGSGVLQQTSTATVNPGEWFRFEVAVLVISSTVGQLECRLTTGDPDAVTATETLTSAATLDTRVDLNRYWFGSASGAAWNEPAGWEIALDDVDWSIYGYPGPSLPPAPAYGQTVSVG